MKAFGPQHWWPAETPLEVVVGAVLTQNTAWHNVEQAIANLRAADLLNWEALRQVHAEELAEVIRPAGYYRLKAARIKNLVRHVYDHHDGSFENWLALDLDTLRESLLSVNGIGPETADAILLYAAQQPTFVVDAYTSRVFKRHGWIEFDADYWGMKDWMESHLPRDVDLFNEYHALLVRVGKSYCQKRPKCDGCPLQPLLPPGGPLEPE